MKLDALLERFPLKLERPPELWEAETDEPGVAALMQAMMAAMSASRTLNANNVVVPFDEDSTIPAGEFVALSVIGDAVPARLAGIEARLVAAGARYAYVRNIPGHDSITVFLDRCAAR